MGTAPDQHVTRLLARTCDGNAESASELFESLYSRLRSMAGSLLQRERSGHTLQATALVHEAWVKLVDVSALSGEAADEARARFLGYAARAMRQVLVDHARQKAADKRGGSWQRVTIGEGIAAVDLGPETMIDLDAAIRELSESQPRVARVAELRLFAGLQLDEIAALIGKGLTVTKQDWSFARAMLSRKLATDEGT